MTLPTKTCPMTVVPVVTGDDWNTRRRKTATAVLIGGEQYRCGGLTRDMTRLDSDMSLCYTGFATVEW